MCLHREDCWASCSFHQSNNWKVSSDERTGCTSARGLFKPDTLCVLLASWSDSLGKMLRLVLGSSKKRIVTS